MNTYPPDYAAFYKGLTNREVILELQSALDRDYAQLREGAGRAWQRQFAGTDLSDACVSVRISPDTPVTAGYRQPGVRGTAARMQSWAWSVEALHAMDDAA